MTIRRLGKSKKWTKRVDKDAVRPFLISILEHIIKFEIPEKTLEEFNCNFYKSYGILVSIDGHIRKARCQFFEKLWSNNAPGWVENDSSLRKKWTTARDILLAKISSCPSFHVRKYLAAEALRLRALNNLQQDNSSSKANATPSQKTPTLVSLLCAPVKTLQEVDRCCKFDDQTSGSSSQTTEMHVKEETLEEQDPEETLQNVAVMLKRKSLEIDRNEQRTILLEESHLIQDFDDVSPRKKPKKDDRDTMHAGKKENDFNDYEGFADFKAEDSDRLIIDEDEQHEEQQLSVNNCETSYLVSEKSPEQRTLGTREVVDIEDYANKPNCSELMFSTEGVQLGVEDLLDVGMVLLPLIETVIERLGDEKDTREEVRQVLAEILDEIDEKANNDYRLKDDTDTEEEINDEELDDGDEGESSLDDDTETDHVRAELTLIELRKTFYEEEYCIDHREIECESEEESSEEHAGTDLESGDEEDCLEENFFENQCISFPENGFVDKDHLHVWFLLNDIVEVVHEKCPFTLEYGISCPEHEQERESAEYLRDLEESFSHHNNSTDCNDGSFEVVFSKLSVSSDEIDLLDKLVVEEVAEAVLGVYSNTSKEDEQSDKLVIENMLQEIITEVVLEDKKISELVNSLWENADAHQRKTALKPQVSANLPVKNEPDIFEEATFVTNDSSTTFGALSSTNDSIHHNQHIVPDANASEEIAWDEDILSIQYSAPFAYLRATAYDITENVLHRADRDVSQWNFFRATTVLFDQFGDIQRWIPTEQVLAEARRSEQLKTAKDKITTCRAILKKIEVNTEIV